MGQRVGTTDFQRRAQAALGALTPQRLPPLQWEWTEAGEDSYLKTELTLSGSRIEIFLYLDEAGFFLDKDWHIFEKIDFDSDGDLIDKFIAALASSLDDQA
jgi:hypothetical protein